PVNITDTFILNETVVKTVCARARHRPESAAERARFPRSGAARASVGRRAAGASAGTARARAAATGARGRTANAGRVAARGRTAVERGLLVVRRRLQVPAQLPVEGDAEPLRLADRLGGIRCRRKGGAVDLQPVVANAELHGAPGPLGEVERVARLDPL